MGAKRPFWKVVQYWGAVWAVTFAQGQMLELVPAGHWQLVPANCL